MTTGVLIKSESEDYKVQKKLISLGYKWTGTTKDNWFLKLYNSNLVNKNEIVIFYDNLEESNQLSWGWNNSCLLSADKQLSAEQFLGTGSVLDTE